MRKTMFLVALVAGLVAACSGSAATGAVPPVGPTTAGTQAAATQAAPAATVQGAAGNPTGGAPATLDACTLLTSAEATAALGEPVDPGVPPEAGARSCIFAGHPAQGVDFNAVEISLTGTGTFDPNKKSIAGLTITPVSGVGDAAYFVSIGAGFEVLSVKKGQTTFTVSVLLKGASDTQLQDAEKTLAALVVGRI